MILDTRAVATQYGDQERIPVPEFLEGIHIFYDLLTSEYLAVLGLERSFTIERGEPASDDQRRIR